MSYIWVPLELTCESCDEYSFYQWFPIKTSPDVSGFLLVLNVFCSRMSLPMTDCSFEQLLLVITCLDGRKLYLPKLQKITCHDKISSKERVTPSTKNQTAMYMTFRRGRILKLLMIFFCFWILFSVKIDFFFLKSHW